MRQLQVVGVSDDGRLLLLAPGADRRPTHCVELDRRLERAVRGQPIDEGDQTSAVMTPKEIQARLRAGQSVEQVAREAGVPIGKVERYAGPVLSERERALDAARASTMVRPRGTPSRLPLGAAVEVNLSEFVHAHPETAEWGVYRRADGSWIVTFEVTVRGRRRRAEWAHQPAAREVVALNSYAASLGMVETVREPKPAVIVVKAPARRSVPTRGARAAKAPAKMAKVPAKAAKAALTATKATKATQVPAKAAPRKVAAKAPSTVPFKAAKSATSGSAKAAPRKAGKPLAANPAWGGSVRKSGRTRSTAKSVRRTS